MHKMRLLLFVAVALAATVFAQDAAPDAELPLDDDEIVFPTGAFTIGELQDEKQVVTYTLENAIDKPHEVELIMYPGNGELEEVLFATRDGNKYTAEIFNPISDDGAGIPESFLYIAFLSSIDDDNEFAEIEVLHEDFSDDFVLATVQRTLADFDAGADAISGEGTFLAELVLDFLNAIIFAALNSGSAFSSLTSNLNDDSFFENLVNIIIDANDEAKNAQMSDTYGNLIDQRLASNGAGPVPQSMFAKKGEMLANSFKKKSNIGVAGGRKCAKHAGQAFSNAKKTAIAARKLGVSALADQQAVVDLEDNLKTAVDAIVKAADAIYNGDDPAVPAVANEFNDALICVSAVNGADNEVCSTKDRTLQPAAQGQPAVTDKPLANYPVTIKNAPASTRIVAIVRKNAGSMQAVTPKNLGQITYVNVFNSVDAVNPVLHPDDTADIESTLVNAAADDKCGMRDIARPTVAQAATLQFTTITSAVNVPSIKCTYKNKAQFRWVAVEKAAAGQGNQGNQGNNAGNNGGTVNQGGNAGSNNNSNRAVPAEDSDDSGTSAGAIVAIVAGVSVALLAVLGAIAYLAYSKSSAATAGDAGAFEQNSYAGKDVYAANSMYTVPNTTPIQVAY